MVKKPALPERLFYKLPYLAKKLNCEIDDLVHFAASSEMKLSVFIDKLEMKPSMALCSYKPFELLDEINEGWSIYGINARSDSCGKIISNTYDFESIQGFFYIIPKDLFALEFTADKKHVDVAFLLTHPDTEEGYYITQTSGFLSVNFDNICIMASELRKIGNKLEMPFLKSVPKPESKKTINKQAEIIHALMTIIFHDIELDSYSPAKINAMLQASAAEKGKKFPEITDKILGEYMKI
ncbi:hypothetical protein [Pantoea sp. SOD02]|uniref:hypothetical protein n=1 Tax=Pantoea sp. SOD02 TaxID=2970818 RepID=UPI0021589150|nr:hypothetical protein [Pantoea sp. SOD02]UVC29309.1 hypothetical protein NR302_19135 [Pantoea sp. SOD02]